MSPRLKILFLAPLPPPVTGHSLVSKVLLDALSKRHDVTLVDLATASKHDGTVTWRRIAEVVKLLRRVRHGSRDSQVVYLTIAESLAGNIKDLMIYLLCANRINRMVLHLHGGSLKTLLFDRWPLIARINRLFIRRMAAVIVLGPSHADVFREMIDDDRIYFVPNFTPDPFFANEDGIRAKFHSPKPLRVLFLSSMDKAKGSPDLIAGYRQLPPDLRAQIQIDIAGRFASEEDCKEFEASLIDLEGVRYHGVVEGDTKRQLLADAHIFCLPTAMLEGQPISILEAYGSGCAVLTTGQPGILDIFTDGVNGLQIETYDPPSIARSLTKALRDVTELERIALNNRVTAEAQYRAEIFEKRIGIILETAATAQ
jgi:glycosyltransferase involved in cell wall biosynthesis